MIYAVAAVLLLDVPVTAFVIAPAVRPLYLLGFRKSVEFDPDLTTANAAGSAWLAVGASNTIPMVSRAAPGIALRPAGQLPQAGGEPMVRPV